MILETSVSKESSDVSIAYAAFVGANLFAHNRLFVRINSHLHPAQLRFLG